MRDYGYIDIDIDALADIGAKLKFEHGNFVPHMRKVVDDMSTPLPAPPGYFTELVEALRTNQVAMQTTVDVLNEQARAIEVMALAAADLGIRYRDADSFSAARAQEVEQQFTDPAAIVRTSQDGLTTVSTPGSGPEAVPVPVPGATAADPDRPGGV